MGINVASIANPIPEIKKLREALEKNAKKTDKHNKILIVLTIVLIVLAGIQIYYVMLQNQPSLMVFTNQETVKLGEDEVRFWVINNGKTDLWLNPTYRLEFWCDGKEEKKLASANLDPEEHQMVEVGKSRFYYTREPINAGKMFYEGRGSCYVRVYVESMMPKAVNQKWIPVELPEGI